MFVFVFVLFFLTHIDLCLFFFSAWLPDSEGEMELEAGESFDRFTDQSNSHANHV